MYVTFLSGSSAFWNDLQIKYSLLNKKESMAVAMMPVLVLVLSGVVSSSLKASLIFWRIKNALPGHRAFTKLAPLDPRIDMAELRKKLGNLPRAAKDQNTVWFKLYKKYANVDVVAKPHGSFLLARDVSTISLIFAIGGTVGLLLGKIALGSASFYFGLMLAQYVVLAIVARNQANSFVCNVLVEHLSKKN